jgi:putative DNA primase/helicase
VSKNYGDAGLEFVRFLHRERMRWPEFRGMFEEARADYLDVAKGNPVLVRIGEHVAVLQVAARLAHEALELPWDWKVPMDKLWDHLVSQADDTQRSARALEDFHAWAVCHQNRFTEGNLTRQFGEADRIGRWVRDADGNTVYLAILPTALTSILRQLRYRQTAGIVRSWNDRGWLLTDGDRQTRRCKTVKIAGESVKCVAIRGDAIIEVTGNGCLLRQAGNPHLPE